MTMVSFCQTKEPLGVDTRDIQYLFLPSSVPERESDAYIVDFEALDIVTKYCWFVLQGTRVCRQTSQHGCFPNPAIAYYNYLDSIGNLHARH